jgi:tetratricopeptide (TPR) repeat protein
MLGIEGEGVTSAGARLGWPLWLRHSLRWAVLAIPFGALCSAQLVGRVVPPLERAAKVAEVLPNDGQAQLNYSKALHEAGRLEEAIGHYDSAIKRDPSLTEAEFFLGLAYQDRQEYDHSVEHYERSLSLDPKRQSRVQSW